MALITLSTSAMAQQHKSCCQAPSATASFASLAGSNGFSGAHESPAAISYAAKGSMITFTTPDGKTGSAYFIAAEGKSNKYIFVFQEWWGLNDYIKRQADLYADSLKGVNIMAIDLYDGKVTTNPEEAGKFMQAADDARIRSIITGAYSHIGKEAKVATVGWCFGGLWSQQGFELKAQELWVETPRPEIDYEYVDEWNDGVPVIDLHTNFPVNATTLHEALHLTLDDQVIGFDLQATGQSTPTEGDRTDRDWRIRFSPADGLPHELALSVRPGLRAAQGELTGTQDEVLLRARVNEPFRLRRTGCAVGHEAYGAPVTDAPTPVRLSCPAGQMLILEFSRDLSAGSLTWLREHLPPGLRFEREDAHSYFRFRAEDGDVSRRPGSFIRLTSDLANRLLELKLPDSLTSDTGKPIVRYVLVEFATTDFLPDLSIEPGYMVVPLDSETPRII